MASATSNASVDVQETASYEAAKIMQQIRNRHIDKVTGKQVSHPSGLMQLCCGVGWFGMSLQSR